MNVKWTFLFVAAALCAGLAQGQAVTKLKVTGERVNLRAKALPEAEVVTQVNQGDILTAKSFQNDWIEVVPPESADLYVHRDFVKDNAVTAAKLYVRGGAGINYSVVAILVRGDSIVVRGEFGEWIKIAPPPGSALWVNRNFVQVIQPERPVQPEPRATAVAPPAERVSTAGTIRAVAQMPKAPAPGATPEPVAFAPQKIEPPADLVLIPLEGQGRYVQREGELKMAGFGFGRPSRYRLVRLDGRQMTVLCYVRGNVQQMRSFLGQTLLIRGREYWVRGEKLPVLIPEQIVPRAGGRAVDE